MALSAREPTTTERGTSERLVRAQTAPLRLVRRAGIVLLSGRWPGAPAPASPT